MANITTRNGVDLEKLVTTTSAIRADPNMAQLKFRANTKWLDGARSRTNIKEFTIDADEPAVLLGSGKAPNAVEMVLAALGSCLAVGFAYNAAARGIVLQSLEIMLEGDLDLQGFLGTSDKVRPGYQNIKVKCRVKSSAPKEKIEELFKYVQRTSPVTDIIRNPVPVIMELEKQK
ncbi:MAG: OsmC family protein [Methanotrichaceae archaeon]